jgi:hypothetical protein
MAVGWMIVALPGAARATCVDGSVSACTVNGCPGERECLSGRWTACIVDSPCPTPTPPGPDFFTANAAPVGRQVGLCVDGKDSAGEVDDRGFTLQANTSSTTFSVGTLGAGQVNEVLTFATGTAPTQFGTPWTTGADSFSGSLPPKVSVPITIWIVAGPWSTQAVQAVSTAIQAGALFDQERVGLDWNLIDIRDATTNPNAALFSNVTSTGPLETSIGHVNGRINVYWVPLVNGGSGNGLGEVANGDSVAVGVNAAPGLLAHEVGHNLALDHVDGDPRFDGTNVMTSNGGSRLFLTEGQAYRAHIRSISAIRSTVVYNLRPGMPIIDTCNISSTTRTCPKADKRLWADGPTWPPN